MTDRLAALAGPIALGDRDDCRAQTSYTPKSGGVSRLVKQMRSSRTVAEPVDQTQAVVMKHSVILVTSS